MRATRSRRPHASSSGTRDDTQTSSGSRPEEGRGGMSPVPDLPDADAIAAAIATCPSVSGLSGGLAGEIATYLPGRRVTGVRTDAGSVEVHVITRYGSPLKTV